MKKIMIIALILFSSFNVFADDQFPNIENHWLRAAPPSSMMLAAYGELTNNSEQEKVLVGAYSPQFDMAEIHKTSIIDGIARMEHQGPININPNESLLFKPGGLHIMLMHPIEPIKEGDIVKICLIYQQGEEKSVQHINFPVVKK